MGRHNQEHSGLPVSAGKEDQAEAELLLRDTEANDGSAERRELALHYVKGNIDP